MATVPMIRNDWRAQLADLNDQAQALHKRVYTDEKRTFTPQEARQYDQLTADWEELKAQGDQLPVARGTGRLTTAQGPLTPLVNTGTLSEQRLVAARQPDASTRGRGRLIGHTADQHKQPIYALGPDLSAVDVVGGAVPSYGPGHWARALLTNNRFSDLPRNAFNESVPAEGGNLVPTILQAQIIDLARAQMRVVQAGATVFLMPSKNTDIAKLTADPVAHWGAEAATTPPSQPTFDLLHFIAQDLTILVEVTDDVAEDAINFPDVLQNSMAQAAALAVDRAVFYGNGLGIPPLTAVAGIGAVPPIGGPLQDFDPFIDAQTVVRMANFEPNAIILNAKTNGLLAKLKDDAGRYLAPPPDFSLMTKLTSNQLVEETGASMAVVGEWSNVYIGIRLDMQLVNDPYYKLPQNTQAFRLRWRGDIKIVRPPALCLVPNISTSSTTTAQASSQAPKHGKP